MHTSELYLHSVSSVPAIHSHLYILLDSCFMFLQLLFLLNHLFLFPAQSSVPVPVSHLVIIIFMYHLFRFHLCSLLYVPVVSVLVDFCIVPVPQHRFYRVSLFPAFGSSIIGFCFTSYIFIVPVSCFMFLHHLFLFSILFLFCSCTICSCIICSCIICSCYLSFRFILPTFCLMFL